MGAFERSARPSGWSCAPTRGRSRVAGSRTRCWSAAAWPRSSTPVSTGSPTVRSCTREACCSLDVDERFLAMSVHLGLTGPERAHHVAELLEHLEASTGRFVIGERPQRAPGRSGSKDGRRSGHGLLGGRRRGRWLHVPIARADGEDRLSVRGTGGPAAPRLDRRRHGLRPPDGGRRPPDGRGVLAPRTRRSTGVPEELDRREEAEEGDRDDQERQQPDEEPLEEPVDREHRRHLIERVRDDRSVVSRHASRRPDRRRRLSRTERGDPRGRSPRGPCPRDGVRRLPGRLARTPRRCDPAARDRRNHRHPPSRRNDPRIVRGEPLSVR